MTDDGAKALASAIESLARAITSGVVIYTAGYHPTTVAQPASQGPWTHPSSLSTWVSGTSGAHPVDFTTRDAIKRGTA